MSQHSLLNIQEISSRTFNNDPSIMETSIEHFQRQNHPNFTKHDLHNMSLKKTIHHGMEDVVRDMSAQNQGLKREVEVWKNRYIEMQRGNGGNLNHAQILGQLSQKLAMKNAQLQEKGRAYNTAIINLKETIAKNQLLSDQVQRLARKLKQSELNYSREQQVYQKSQNLISNLSITKSNYEIELVNMKDSLIILEKENQKIADTNEQYQEKLALISQEIERLNRKDQNARKEKNELQAKIKKYQLEITDQKSALEKMRMENRDCNNKIQALSMQLRDFHEQITYKDTIINDYKIGQSKIERLLKEKEGYIKELQSRIVQMQRYFKNKQEEFNKQRSSYSQEIAKLRAKISEQTTSSKQVVVRSENIQKQYQKLYQQHGYLKSQVNKEAHEKQALFQQFKSVSNQRDSLIRDKQELIRQLDTLNNQNRQLNNQIQSLKSDLLMWQDKYQKTEEDFRRYEENERTLINEYQAKITQINQQRLAELNAKVSELNQCKFDLANKINEINQIKTEISIKSTEIIRLKEDTTAQSNIFEFSRKEYDDKLRERMDMINDLKNRLVNCEKMIDQNRRERDMLLQQNQSLINAKEKSQRAIQLKNQEINTSTVKIEQLGRSLKEISSVQDKKSQQVQNCKRIIRSNQDTIKELNLKLVSGDNNMKNLSIQLQRVVNILKEKQTIIIDLSNKCRQHATTIEKNNLQVSNLKQNNQKMHMSLSYAQQSNSNFQIFMKQIERLNQIVLGKDGEIKNLRGQLGRLIQKIDQISQQQLKIVKVLQASYQSASQRDIDTNNQFTGLKDFISRLNQNTNTSLKDLYTQSSSIINQLSQTENETRQNSSKIQEKLIEAQRTVERKETEIILLRKEVKDLQVKIEQYSKSSVNQSEIFEKILQLSRQNAAVREQMMRISSQRENQMENKNKNITYLESQLKQLQAAQGKELSQMKQYLQEKERVFEQRSVRLSQQNTALKQQIHQRDRIIAQYENRINHISLEIDNKMQQMQQLKKELSQNSSQLQAYKKMHQQNQQSRELISQIQIYQNQISKLVRIIEIRQEQLTKNQESFEKLQKQTKRYKQKNMQLQLKCQQHAEQKYHLQQKLRQSQTINYHFQQMQAKTNNSSQSTRQVQALKEQNEALDRRLKQFYTKLRQNEGKLSMTQEQVSNLMHSLSKVGEIHNEIHEIQALTKRINELQERNYHLENQLEDALGKLKQLQIENNYLLHQKEQRNIFLQKYQYKKAEIERQNKKLKEVYDNMSRQYSKLQMKNHEFEMQLKKAQILQQNIQVLKGQLNRLSQINIDLNEEVSSCKLALSDESTIQRRNTQLLTLIVILMAEIQSLRSRIAAKQLQQSNSRILNLSRSRS